MEKKKKEDCSRFLLELIALEQSVWFCNHITLRTPGHYSWTFRKKSALRQRIR